MARYNIEDVIGYDTKTEGVVCEECYSGRELDGVITEEHLEREIIFCDKCGCQL